MHKHLEDLEHDHGHEEGLAVPTILKIVILVAIAGAAAWAGVLLR